MWLALGRVLDECLAEPVWAKPESPVVDELDQLLIAAQKIAAATLARVREVDGRGLAVAEGATSTLSWLRDRHRISGGAASRLVKLARAVDVDSPTQEALAAGAVNVEQAHIITDAVAKLPAEHRKAGEEHLLGEAATFGPRELGRLGQRIFEVVAPEQADKQALAEVERAERPPRWTDAHHIVHWSSGGPTDLDNLVLLCGHHHRLIHHSDWQVKINSRDGLPEFTPPAYVDADRRPRRNKYHRRT